MTGTAPALDDLLLTMDMVDELRHRENELHQHSDTAGQREALRARLRAFYARQGLEVSDTIIDEAITAHLDNRFAYRAPRESFALRLARVYVDRVRWFRRVGLATAMVALVSGGYWAGVVLPAHSRAVAAVAEVNTLLAEDAQRYRELSTRLAQARQQPHLPDPIPALVLAQVQRLAETRKDSLDTAERLLDPLDPATLPAPITLETAKEQGTATRAAATAFQTVLSQAAAALEQADALEVTSRELVVLVDTVATAKSGALTVAYPGRLDERKARIFSALDSGLQTGDVATVKANLSQLKQLSQDAQTLSGLLREAMSLHQAGERAATASAARGALNRAQDAFTAARTAGDLPTAKAAFAELKEISDLVQVEITYRIVSEPGVQSGVWRYPEDNPRAKNYYIVVDALRDGKPYALTVTSQEDNRSQRLSRFAVRVSEAFYEQVKADKMADGIVDNNVLGRKPVGTVDPAFVAGVLGGYIHHW